MGLHIIAEYHAALILKFPRIHRVLKKCYIGLATPGAFFAGEGDNVFWPVDFFDHGDLRCKIAVSNWEKTNWDFHIKEKPGRYSDKIMFEGCLESTGVFFTKRM